MNTTQLECFAEVATTLSFARASERLNMTQPAVSKQVKSLEAELGVRLFERTTRSVALTPAGEGFLPDALEMLSLMSASAQRAARQRNDLERTVRVGYVDTVELVMLSKVWRRMRADEAGVHPVLHLGLQDDNVNAVAKGRLDAAIGMHGLLPEVDGVAFEKLGESTLRCVLPARNRLVSRGKVSPGDLADMSQAVCMPDDLRRVKPHTAGFRAVPVHPGQEVFMCSSVAEACSLVGAGLAYALVPSQYIMKGTGMKDVELAKTETIPYGVFTREKSRTPIVDRFVRVLKELYSQA